MRLALCQINPTVGDFAGNTARILDFASRAKSAGAELAVFSELALCGYPPQDLVERPAFLARNRTELDCLAKKLPLSALVGYVGENRPARGKPASGKPAANCAALLAPGKGIAFEQRKMLLPTYDVFDESRYFEPAAAQQIFAFGGETLGITICEDIWNDKQFWSKPLYARDPVTELVGKGTTLLVNLSSSPYTLGKRTVRLEMLRALAKHHNRPVAYVNQVGGNDSLVFDGSSLVVAADGRVAAQARSFEEDLVLFDTGTGKGDIRPQPEDELEAAFLALTCGTRDYLHKSGFRSAVVGLSGGIDSAVVAAIAAAALGAENVLGVAMPGPYSSAGALRDAERLAKNLSIRFLTIPINELFQAYRGALAGAFAGRVEDVTEENIQARIRGNLLMALSNKFGSLVLSTGNKSELAVGYCTLYGDMAGGMAVISDVPKTMVYELAAFLNRGREVIPADTIAKAPSAELRPNQTDQDSLPAYDILDRIIKLYVEDLRSPEDIADATGYELALVQRMTALISRNEYKRKQAAPGLKITSRAFSVGRSFPIVQKFLG